MTPAVFVVFGRAGSSDGNNLTVVSRKLLVTDFPKAGKYRDIYL